MEIDSPAASTDDLNLGQSAIAQVDASSMTVDQKKNFCRQYLKDRQRGRTDLLWLCNAVLHYKDVEPEMHGPVIQHVQSFYGHQEYMDYETFTIAYSEPHCAIHNGEAAGTNLERDSCNPDCVGRTPWYLPGPRFRMLLDPRGTLKTTVNTISHSIQWILNFTDIRIALSVATSMQGSDIITEVENHFRYNETFRFLYPEYCPIGDKAGDWGSKEQFIVPNRRRRWLKEPTMRVVSIGKVVAGPHYEVVKHSDLVDKENVKTAGGLKDTKEHFKYTQPLLERGPVIEGRDRTVGWQDLEGTIYDHSDLYCEELDKDDERASRGAPCRWSVFCRDSIVDPVETADIDWSRPLKTLWPSRFPWTELRAIFEDIGEYLFNCQYRLRATARGLGLAQKNEIGYFPSRFRKVLAPQLYIKTTVDLAGMEEDTEGCNIAVVTVGHARDGRKFVFEALVRRPTPFEIIDYLFDLDARYSTNLTQKLVIQGENAHHWQSLMPFITREMEIRGRFLNIVTIPRDSNVSKDNRIFYGLQPWFRKRLIWFADDISCLPHIVNEITKFPKFKFKDFLDALADQAQTKDGKIDDQTAIPSPKEVVEDHLKLQGKFMGFDPVTKQPTWSTDGPSADYYGTNLEEEMKYHETMTGAL